MRLSDTLHPRGPTNHSSDPRSKVSRSQVLLVTGRKSRKEQRFCQICLSASTTHLDEAKGRRRPVGGLGGVGSG
ncbi:hypothetical protein CDAR_387881 [Caerostris darwini]|uniref:Uncharacterized protein n=1 Tax=Caerostris darwini TaxID=1538125 RepID=A0AAV4SUV9_9ARAC|nr:hypothetical protein CDAR_387881 [Caerostris darwini]